MTASGRTPVGSPLTDPSWDSELGLPRTYGRTHGDELVKRDIRVLVSSAREGENPAHFDSILCRTVVRSCLACDGAGTYYACGKTCFICNGNGTVRRTLKELGL